MTVLIFGCDYLADILQRRGTYNACGYLPGIRPPQQQTNTAFDLHPSAVHYSDPVANILDIGKQVAAQQNGIAATSQLNDKILHLPCTQRVHAGCRLVQDKYFRIVYKCLSQADPSCHAL